MSLRIHTLAITLLSLCVGLEVSAEVRRIGSGDNAGALTLESYLGQVKGRNQTVQGSLEGAKAAREESHAKDLALAPTLFANAQWMGDSKLPQLPFFTYGQLNVHTYSLGVTKQTSFGLQAKLAYELDYTSFMDAVFPGGMTAGPGIPLRFYDAAPRLELSQSLWGNGFGRGVQAQRDLIEAQSRVSEHLNKFQAKNEMLRAETAYWRLAVARMLVEVEEQALEQATKIHDWTSRRARMHLADESDALQSRAALEYRRLELKSAQDEARAAARNFNAIRNVASDEVAERLPELSSEMVRALPAPERGAAREDVQAAEAQKHAAEANTKMAEEKLKPTLDVYGSFALNGRQQDIPGTLGNSYTAHRPTKIVGVKLSMPLDFGELELARHGSIRERNAAEMVYRQRVLDQEQSWTDLARRLQEAKERLELTETIEGAQEAKLVSERSRLSHGRTTTYQVLLFEQDFSQAQLARLRAQSEVLGILAQMKLYGAQEI